MRFNNLQLLRLLAAAGVLLMHLGIMAEQAGMSGAVTRAMRMEAIGALWVPVFFALSGFVLTHMLQGCPPGRYLVLRALRLYPAYWLAVAATVGVAQLGPWPGAYLFDPDPSATCLLLVPVPPTRLGESVLLVEWTLVYEVFLSVALVGVWAAAGPRRLTAAVVGWLAVLAVKSVGWPGYGTAMLASWKSIALSAHVVPFLFGVLAYQFRARGRGRGWWAAPVAVGAVAAAALGVGLDGLYWLFGAAAGLIVWLAVRLPDARANHPLVVAGGYSYGLYLIHFPATVFALHAFARVEWLAGTWAAVALAGAVAVAAGLAFGRFDLALYARLKRLADFSPTAAGRRLKCVVLGRRAQTPAG